MSVSLTNKNIKIRTNSFVLLTSSSLFPKKNNFFFFWNSFKYYNYIDLACTETAARMELLTQNLFFFSQNMCIRHVGGNRLFEPYKVIQTMSTSL